MTGVLDRIAFVAALDVPPGAVLVAKSSRKLTVEQAETISAAIAEAIPGHKVIVLPPEIQLDVVRETSE